MSTFCRLVVHMFYDICVLYCEQKTKSSKKNQKNKYNLNANSWSYYTKPLDMCGQEEEEEEPPFPERLAKGRRP